MLKNTSSTITKLTQKKLKELDDDMDFTLVSYYKERINHHMKMLNYYLKEQSNEKLGT
jgi:predicted DNA-binding protein